MNKETSERFRIRGLGRRRRASRGFFALPRRRKHDDTVFSRFSLSLYDGRILALMGVSGVGKSTLARVLMGLEPFDEGEIYYKNTPIGAVDRRRFRRENTMLFQEILPAVNPLFSVREIILEPLRINLRLNRNELERRLRELAELTEVETRLFDRFPRELSGGELRRVELARALALKPEYIFLDEPFASLDELTAQRLMIRFQQLFRALNMGALFICHHAHHAAFFADETVRFADCLEQPDASGSVGNPWTATAGR